MSAITIEIPCLPEKATRPDFIRWPSSAKGARCVMTGLSRGLMTAVVKEHGVDTRKIGKACLVRYMPGPKGERGLWEVLESAPGGGGEPENSNEMDA